MSDMRKALAEAWEQGAQAGWVTSGEGWNAEHTGRHYPSDEFRQMNPDIQNPYLPDED